MAQLQNVGLFVTVFSTLLILGLSTAVQRSDHRTGCEVQTAAKRYVTVKDRPRTFFEAWRFCAAIGLRMATVTSPDDSRLIEQAVNASGASVGTTWWIGGTDLGHEGSFVWISTNLPVGYRTGYFNYSPGQPDNYKDNEHCLEIGRFAVATWNDMPCEAKLRFICEFFNPDATE